MLGAPIVSDDIIVTASCSVQAALYGVTRFVLHCVVVFEVEELCRLRWVRACLRVHLAVRLLEGHARAERGGFEHA